MYGSIAIVAGFLRPAEMALPRHVVTTRATYQVTLEMPDGQVATIPCDDDVFILDAAEEAGFELPSSCRSGACTSCQGRVLKGSISMDDQDTLEDEHIAAGYVCTCIAYPESDVTIKTHQMDNFENGVMVFDDVKTADEPVPAPVSAPVPAPAPIPATVSVPAPSSDVDALKIDLAKKTLAMLKEVVAGRTDLEEKCEELAILLDGGSVVPATKLDTADKSEDMAKYIPFRSDDCGYTIWLNRDDHTNSWYEYHDKK